MAPNKQLLEAWQNGVAFRHAWWALADERTKKRFLELRRSGDGSHGGLQRSLEIDIVDRLEAGQLKAIGIEDGRDPRPVFIASYYFSKVAEIDWDMDTVEAFGKKFYEVRVRHDRKPREALTNSEALDLRLLPSEPADEKLPIEPTVQAGPQSPNEPPSGGSAPAVRPKMGRPLLVGKVREVVRELIDRDEFAHLTKGGIERLVFHKARERFPTSFPTKNRPSKNTINKALRLEEWPPPPKKSNA
jgi:hypothetical protein